MKKIVALCLSLVLALGLLAGCGGVGGGSSDKILRFGQSSIGGVFNPVLANELYDDQVTQCLFDYLIANDAEGVYHPDIATWELSEDRLTYTFTLQQGIKFTDGVELTAEDVAFTYAMMAHPEYDGPRSYAVDRLVGYEAYSAGETDVFEGIQVLDTYKISFTFQEGQASPANIESFIYGIMPKHYYEKETYQEFADLADKPLGSGKFILESYELNEQITLTANADYWNTDKRVKIGGISIVNVPEESILTSLESNAIDFGMLSASQDNYDALVAAEGITPVNFPGNGYTYLQFNTTREKLSDVRVRQALMYALDREAFISNMYGEDLGSVGMAPISPVSWAFPDSSDLNAYAYDQAKAAELMDAAGWEMGDDGYRYKDGEKFTVSWLVYDDSPWPGVLSGMAYDSWKELGVDLVIEKMDFISVNARVSDPPPEEKDFDIYTMGFSLSIDPDPKGALFDADAYVAGGFNASGFRDERSQELMNQGRAEFDTEKRAPIYKEWAILQNELIPTVIIAYRNEIWGIRENVKNLTIDTYVQWPALIHEVTIE